MDEAARGLLNRGMAALADGDRGAFDPGYRSLWPFLGRFVPAISRDPMMPEDVAQQAMLKILARVSTFDRSKDALAWSMSIALNEYRSYRRKLGNRAASQDAAGSIEPINDDTPEAIATRDNLAAAARAVLGKLRPQDLDVLVAAIYEGPRPPLTAAAFRKRLQRVIAHTRLIWKRHYGDDGNG